MPPGRAPSPCRFVQQPAYPASKLLMIGLRRGPSLTKHSWPQNTGVPLPDSPGSLQIPGIVNPVLGSPLHAIDRCGNYLHTRYTRPDVRWENPLRSESTPSLGQHGCGRDKAIEAKSWATCGHTCLLPNICSRPHTANLGCLTTL